MAGRRDEREQRVLRALPSHFCLPRMVREEGAMCLQLLCRMLALRERWAMCSYPTRDGLWLPALRRRRWHRRTLRPESSECQHRRTPLRTSYGTFAGGSRSRGWAQRRNSSRDASYPVGAHCLILLTGRGIGAPEAKGEPQQVGRADHTPHTTQPNIEVR